LTLFILLKYRSYTVTLSHESGGCRVLKESIEKTEFALLGKIFLAE